MNKVASQFIVNKDGSIVQCVPMDAIAHHAGYGDAGHNSEYGVPEDGRDDKRGTTKAPSKSITDYGMNSYSIGIEIVHVGGQGAYPEAQLEAIDGLIAYIVESGSHANTSLASLPSDCHLSSPSNRPTAARSNTSLVRLFSRRRVTSSSSGQISLR